MTSASSRTCRPGSTRAASTENSIRSSTTGRVSSAPWRSRSARPSSATGAITRTCCPGNRRHRRLARRAISRRCEDRGPHFRNGRHEMNRRLMVLTLMILAAAMARLVPHPPNMTPIGAMALFGGACFLDRRMAYLLPMAAMLLSDLVLGFTHYGLWRLLAIQPVVYACILATTAIGQFIAGSSVGVAGGRGGAGGVAPVLRGHEFRRLGRRAWIPDDGRGPRGVLSSGYPVLPQHPRRRRRLHRDPVRRAGHPGESPGVDAPEARSVPA